MSYKELKQGVKARILINDDEEEIRFFLKRYFIKKNYEVFTASNGNEGFMVYKEEYKHKGIDLVITDIKMSPMDGFQFFEKIRKLDHNACVYFMSGYCDYTKLDKMLNKGAAGFISKPFDLDQLEEIRLNSIKKDMKLKWDQADFS